MATLPPQTCPICIDTFTAQLRKEIQCPSCQVSSCSQCIQTYLLTIADDPNCPNCHHRWTYTFLQSNLPDTFMRKKYTQHRSQILWGREESYIPQYQPYAERILRAEKFKAELIVPLESRRKVLAAELERVDEDIARLDYQMRTILDDTAAAAAVAEGQTQRSQSKWRCTTPDCKGWLSSSWKCGLCDNYTCSTCLCPRAAAAATHTCSPDDVLTATEIRKSTRPCPKCGHAIQRSDGCDMMFCTSCHTPFNWKTGNIVTSGAIHNPHYYEWLGREGAATVGREHGDIPCGGIPGPHYLTRVSKYNIYRKVANMHRLVEHIHDIDYREWNDAATENHNRDYMVSYLLGKDSKDVIQRKLSRDEVKRERARAIYNIYETFVTVGSEYLRAIESAVTAPAAATTAAASDQISDIVSQFKALIEFTNEGFKAVRDGYDLLSPHIIITSETSLDWKIVTRFKQT